MSGRYGSTGRTGIVKSNLEKRKTRASIIRIRKIAAAKRKKELAENIKKVRDPAAVAARKKIREKKYKSVAEKKKKIPSGGISLGVKSKTTWKQTPTSRAVDDRKLRKEWKTWAKGGHKGRQPIGYAPPVGSVAQTKRRTKYKTDAKGGKTTRSVTDYQGPGGMVPEHLKMARPKKK